MGGGMGIVAAQAEASMTPPAAAPDVASGLQAEIQPPPCTRCGHGGFMTGVTLNTASGALFLQLRDGTQTVPTATICSGCGDVQIAVNLALLFQSFARNA